MCRPEAMNSVRLRERARPAFKETVRKEKCNEVESYRMCRYT